MTASADDYAGPGVPTFGPIVSRGPVVHGVECYEAWRDGRDCPHEVECTCPAKNGLQQGRDVSHALYCPSSVHA